MDVTDIFNFFSTRRGEGESEAPGVGGGGSFFFFLKIPGGGGGLQEGGGAPGRGGDGRVSVWVLFRPTFWVKS